MLQQNNLQLITKTLLFAFIFAITTVAKAQETKWTMDQDHSKISFSVPYFKIGSIKGNFDTFKGSITSNGENFEDAKLTITIKTASINTNQTDRDEALRSSDFFDANKHPEITFVSESFKRTADNIFEVKGKFTMTGITKDLTLKAVYKGSFLHPRFKEITGIFEITGIIPREDFHVGTNYPPAKLLGNAVTLTAEIHSFQAK